MRYRKWFIIAVAAFITSSLATDLGGAPPDCRKCVYSDGVWRCVPDEWTGFITCVTDGSWCNEASWCGVGVLPASSLDADGSINAAYVHHPGIQGPTDAGERAFAKACSGLVVARAYGVDLARYSRQETGRIVI